MTPPRPSVPSRAMRVRLHLKPGQKGTKQLLAQYGDRLVCVRYRYDAQRKKRLKTVELAVAERDCEPAPRAPAHDQIVALRVTFAEVAVRERVKQAGGHWDPDRKVWELRYDLAVALGSAGRIVVGPASTGGFHEQRAEYLYVYAGRASTWRCLHPTIGCQRLVVDASVAAQL